MAPPQHLLLCSLLAGVVGGWLSHDGGTELAARELIGSGGRWCTVAVSVRHTPYCTPHCSHRERNGTLWTVMKDLTSDKSNDNRRIVWDLILRLESPLELSIPSFFLNEENKQLKL